MLIRTEPVRSIMTTDVVAVAVDARPSDVRDLLRSRPFHHVPVVDGALLVGILSAADLARISLEAWGVDPDTTDATLDAAFSIEAIMSADVATIRPEEPILRATELLAEGTFHALPVVDAHGHLVGIVTSTDLLRYLYRSF
jgi:CBS domain-containing membrane protein